MSRLRPLAGDPIRLYGIDLNIRLHDGLEPAIKKGILGRFGLANEGRTGHPSKDRSMRVAGWQVLTGEEAGPITGGRSKPAPVPMRLN